MKHSFILVIATFLILGCTQHKIKLETTKPLQIDVNMRIDVYQHVEKQVNSIEDLIEGKSDATNKAEVKPQSFRIEIESIAYAQEDLLEGLSDASKGAIASRKARKAALDSIKAKGEIGENHLGLVEVRGAASAAAGDIAEAENRDRKVIYGDLAKANGVSADEIGRVYAKRLQDGSPQGTPIEIPAGSGGYKWAVK